METNDQSVFAGQSISVGCHLTVASYALSEALLKLRDTAPDFRIELKHDFSRNIQMEIQKGRLDIGVVINPVRVPDLVIFRLGVDRVSVWSKAGAFSADTLIYNPQLLQSQSILKNWKDRPRKTIETEGLELICRLTAKGLGYGIIPTRAVELSNESLVAIKSLPSFKDEIALVYRPEFGKTAAERALIEAIKSAF